MKPIHNWPVVLRRAWSLRLMALVWLLSAAEVGFTFFTDGPPLGLSRGTFAAAAMATTVAAAIARFVAQPSISGDPE